MKSSYNTLLCIAIFCETLSLFEANDHPLNVGTVLFSPSDLVKKRWSKKEIGLLRARRYFQKIIPPPTIINNFHEDYVDMLLDYFRDAYSLIKREAIDPDADSVMTAALTDTIGGYLKVWVLPVTKFAFYGGTVSQENALKLFRFYREIRSYMKSDGKGWQNPDPYMLSTIAINVVQPRRVPSIRSMDSPCEHLAYYVKTPSGLSIPVPHVNWNEDSSTMFLPLKNETLIPLESPDSTNNLFNYYNVAKTCMQSSSPDDQAQFDQRFQTWLTDDVVPHLNNDHLYLALGSVLTLVNTTRSLCDTIIDLYGNNVTKARASFYIAGFPIDITSRKTMIITVILLLEVAWCIPALLYIMCKKRKKDRGSNVYLFVEPTENTKKYPKEKLKFQKQGIRGRTQRNVCASTSRADISTQGLKFTQRPRKNTDTKCSSVIKNNIATGAQSFLTSKVCSAEVARVLYDSPMNSLKTSLKVITAQSVHTIKTNPPVGNTNQGADDGNRPDANTGPTESYSTVQELEATKTVTLIRENEKNGRKHVCKYKYNSVNENQKVPLKDKQIEATKPCPCLCCFTEDSAKKIYEEQPNKASKTADRTSKSKTLTYSNKVTETNSKLTRIKEIKVSRNKGGKLTTGKPYVEITIDRPQTEISVGITGMSRKEQVSGNTRPSKIPKLSHNSAKVQASCLSSNKHNIVSPEMMCKRKSYIPQPRNRTKTLDDIVIKNRGTSMRENKLNVTL